MMDDEFDLAPPPEEITVTDTGITPDSSPDIFESQEAGAAWFDSLVDGTNQESTDSQDVPEESINNHGSQSQVEGNLNEITNTMEAQAHQESSSQTMDADYQKIDLDSEVSLEADMVGNIHELETLIASMESDGGVDKYTAQRIDLLTAGALSRRVPINSFTRDKSKTNLTVSMEVSDMARMAMYGVAGVTLLGIGYMLLKRQIEMSQDPRNRQATETIRGSSTLRNERLDYTKSVRRMTSHIQSGALRNANLLQALEVNAKRRLPNIEFSERDPSRFGEELVHGVWMTKIEKIWSPFMHAVTNDSAMKNNINALSKAYISASRDFHDKLRDLKSKFKLDEKLNYEDFRISYKDYEPLLADFGGGNYGGREAAKRVNRSLEVMTEHDPGLKVPSIDRVLTIYLDTVEMNRLDADTFNLATRINVLFTDMQLFATKYMESSPHKNNRISILEELEKDMRTLGSTYASLINARNNARSLVVNIRSAINESRGLWQAIERDQNGRI